MKESFDDGKVAPEHVHLLQAAAQGKLTIEQERELEVFLNQKPAYRLELDRLILLSAGSCHVEPSLSSIGTQMPALCDAMNRWMATPGWKKEHEVDCKIPFESDSIVLVRKLGQGGMGVVYEGFDKHLGRSVAVKFLSEQWSKNPSARERLLGEAQAAAQVQHENIVSIFAIHPTEIAPYIVQQFVRGETLQQWIDRSGPLESRLLEELTVQLSRGLAAAHRCGLIHRDMKPENILIEHGTGIVRISDFGLAQRLGTSRHTREGVLTGTPTFMSPEQTRGETLDHRSDLFSLGSLLYCAATGKAPFEGEEPYVVMDRIRNGSPTPLAKLRADLNPVWVAAVERLLKKDRKDRFESAEQLLALIAPTSATISNLNRPLVWFATLASCLALIATIALSVVLLRPPVNTDGPILKDEDHGNPVEPLVEPISFLVKGESERVYSLSQAIELAPPNSAVMVFGMGELDCDSVRIRGKSLQIFAVNTGKVLLKAKPISLRTKEPFISTDSDLTLSGLNLFSDRSGPLDAPIQSIISIEQKSVLVLNECNLTSIGTSTCILANGKEIRAMNSCFFAEQGFAVAGALSKLQLKMVGCLLVARNCVELISSDRSTTPPEEPPIALFNHCTLEHL